jgi:hypothetical protein
VENERQKAESGKWRVENERWKGRKVEKQKAEKLKMESGE